jgi:polysaccharide export outer membrane protein
LLSGIAPTLLRQAPRAPFAAIRLSRFANLEARLFTYAVRAVLLAIALLVTACSDSQKPLPAADTTGGRVAGADYIIGPGDRLNIFVWRNPELTVTVPVRPDGKISVPLVEDIIAVGKTPSMLAREIEEKLKKFVVDPRVTVISESFVGPFDEQVRVIGEAAQPRAVSYRAKMTLLDVMIEVGGLTKFASGNRAVIVRRVKGEQQSFPVKLDNLIKDGDVSYNVPMQPGDILIIPQSYF